MINAKPRFCEDDISSNPVTAYALRQVRGSSCMSRLARMVVPDLPHHVTQRGNRREPIFFEDDDQQIYCDMLAEQFRKYRVEVWAYCLMPIMCIWF